MAALVRAAGDGALARVRKLLDGGVRVDATDGEGRTEFWLPADDLSEARLVMTEDLIRVALRAAKKGISGKS